MGASNLFTALGAVIGAALVYLSFGSGMELLTYYTFIASAVVISALKCRNLSVTLLGYLFFICFLLENSGYPDWANIKVLAVGHLLISFLAFLLVYPKKQPILLVFPALILCQFIIDVTLSQYHFIGYANLHNVLATFRMGLFLPLAWSMTHTSPDPLRIVLAQWTNFVAIRSRHFAQTLMK